MTLRRIKPRFGRLALVLVAAGRSRGRWGGFPVRACSEGCAREVLEETGYRVEVGPLTGVYKNIKLGVISLAFRCALVAGEARTSEESAVVSWWTLDEIKRNVPEARAVRVFDALDVSGVPAHIHDGSELIDGISRVDSAFPG